MPPGASEGPTSGASSQSVQVRGGTLVVEVMIKLSNCPHPSNVSCPASRIGARAADTASGAAAARVLELGLG